MAMLVSSTRPLRHHRDDARDRSPNRIRQALIRAQLAVGEQSPDWDQREADVADGCG